MESIGGEMIEGQAARGAAGDGLGIQIRDGRGVERHNSKGRIFGTDFFDKMEALKVRGVDIKGNGVPSAHGEGLEEFGKGRESADAHRRGGRVRESLGKLRPGQAFPEKDDLKHTV